MTLEKAVLIIAVWDIGMGLLGAVAAIWGLVMVAEKAQEHSEAYSVHNNVTFTTESSVTTPATASTASDTTNHGAWLCAVLSMFIVYMLFQAVFGAILIVGLNKEKLMLYKAWFVFRISGVMFTLGTFISFVFLQDSATFQPTIVDGVGVLFSLYCIYIVYLKFKELKLKQTTMVKPFKT